MSEHGETIGKIQHSAVALGTTVEARIRNSLGQNLNYAVIRSVLRGAGREPVLVLNEEGRYHDSDVYAEPPIKDPQEATRLSKVIRIQIDEVEAMQNSLLGTMPHEYDTFIQRRPDVNAPIQLSQDPAE